MKDVIHETATSKDEVLTIGVSLTSMSPTKKIEYRPWAGSDISFDRDYATLKDNFGNGYKRLTFGLGARPVGAVEGSALVYPDKPVTDVLVFEMPLGTATYLDLELPARNYGCEGTVRFRIPMASVRNSPEFLRRQAVETAAARKAEEERQRAEAAEREEREKAEQERQSAAETARLKAAREEQARLEQAAREKKAAESEAAAGRRLAYAQKLLDAGKTDQAAAELHQIHDRYPDTKAADEARKLLKEIEP